MQIFAVSRMSVCEYEVAFIFLMYSKCNCDKGTLSAIFDETYRSLIICVIIVRSVLKVMYGLSSVLL